MSVKRSALIKLHNEITTLFKNEDIMWRQTTRCRWIQEGNTNTVFFHRHASMRRRINTTQSLSSDYDIAIRTQL